MFYLICFLQIIEMIREKLKSRLLIEKYNRYWVIFTINLPIYPYNI